MKPDPKKILHLPLHYCICCGDEQGLRALSFTHIEKDAISLLWNVPLIGVDLFGLIFENYIRPKRTVVSTFCEACSERFGTLNTANQIGGLVFLVVVFISVIIITVGYSENSVQETLIAAGICLSWLAGIKIAIRFYIWKYSPKISKIKPAFVELKVKGKEEIVKFDSPG